MNAAVAIEKQRSPSAASRVWYATLILIPVLTAAGLFWLRQLEVRAHARRTIANYGSVPAFSLTNQDSQPFGSAQLSGKIWIADFVFTSCPGPCPIISSRMSELQKPLEKSDVHLVTFSVDPETDTPEVLRDYAARLHARPGRWDFLTGDKANIYRLSKDGFKLAVAEGAGDEGQLVHSTRAALVDRHGTIRGYYDVTAPDGVTTLLADTSQLLREQPTPTH
jgi:protein SCO1/2